MGQVSIPVIDCIDFGMENYLNQFHQYFINFSRWLKLRTIFFFAWLVGEYLFKLWLGNLLFRQVTTPSSCNCCSVASIRSKWYMQLKFIMKMFVCNLFNYLEVKGDSSWDGKLFNLIHLYVNFPIPKPMWVRAHINTLFLKSTFAHCSLIVSSFILLD